MLTTRELLQVVGPPLTSVLLKNWTNGRPVMIVPSVKRPQGKGSRSIWSEKDAVKLAVGLRLKEDGFGFDLIQHVFDYVQFDGMNHWLLLRIDGKRIDSMLALKGSLRLDAIRNAAVLVCTKEISERISSSIRRLQQ